MLVLGRKPGTRVVLKIPPSAEERTVIVEVVAISVVQTRLGFSAPEEIVIAREELLEKPDG